MKTYQDLLELGENENARNEFVLKVIADHKASAEYEMAKIADEYDRKQNRTIKQYQKLLYTMSGKAVPDNYSANHKTVSGFFPRFVTQQNQYLLGNGVKLEAKNKERLGVDFDTQLQRLSRHALVEMVSFGFWNLDHLEVFRYLEFAPLWDEEDGSLKAGVRFWQVDDQKPLRATLYELDGYTEFIKRKDEEIQILTPKRTYQQVRKESKVGGVEIRDGENYPGFPIIPLWANAHHQSELVGVRESIDCYDLIKSGFANDVDDASMIYWTLENAGGMDDVDLAQFLDRMKTVRAAVVDGNEGSKATAHTLDVPHEAREKILNRIKSDLYEDFQVINVQELTSGERTATEIRAAYQPMDNKIDEYEYCVLDFLHSLFEIVGIEDEPSFTRSRIVNQTEETQMVLMAAQYLDDETILKKLPWLTQEEVDEVLNRTTEEESKRLTNTTTGEPLEE